MHKFIDSQKIETKYTQLHDRVYKGLLRAGYTMGLIDRETCSYSKEEGRKYQKADTDVILNFIDSGGGHGKKRISEKTRTTNFSDVLLEVISVLKKDKKTGLYLFDQYGWATAHNNYQTFNYEPEFLSIVFLGSAKENLKENLKENQNTKKFNSCFIHRYPQLKEKLFIETGISKLISSNEFILWANEKIKQQVNTSFGSRGARLSFSTYFTQRDTECLGNDFLKRIKNVSFAYNPGYYTVSFIYTHEEISRYVPLKWQAGLEVNNL